MDHDKSKNQLRFRHSETDEKIYIHNREEYFKYLFVNSVKVNFHGRIMYYHRKPIFNCYDVVVFRYDLSKVPSIEGQNEILNMCLGDKFIGYYKLNKIDVSLKFISTEYVPSMVYISTEFESAMKNKQFDGVGRRGYAIESALFDGRNDRSRIHRFFSNIFQNTDRDLDMIAGEHDNLFAELYEIQDYKQVTKLMKWK